MWRTQGAWAVSDGLTAEVRTGAKRRRFEYGTSFQNLCYTVH